MLQSQTPAIDSLKNELLTHPEKDTTRVLILNDLIYDLHLYDIAAAKALIPESEDLIYQLNFIEGEAQLYYYKNFINQMQSNFPKAIENCEKAVELYATFNHKQGMSYSYINMGINYYYLGEFTKSIECYEKAAAINEKINDLRGLAAVLDNIGTIYADQGKYDEAIINYKKSKNIQESLGDSSGVALVYNNLGSIYAEQGDYPRALENFHKCLTISESLNDETQKISILYNLAFIHVNQKEYDKALNCYKSALKISRTQQNKRLIADQLNGIGAIYKEQFNHKRALVIFKKTLAISKSINIQSIIGESLNNIAEMQLIFEKDDIALDYYFQALEINKEMDTSWGKCTSYLGLANTYVYKGQYQVALEYTLNAEDLAVKSDLIEFQRDAKELTAIIYEKIGKYEEAFKSHEEFKILNDQLFNEENIRKIKQLEYEYKYKQELEAADLRELTLKKTVNSTVQDLEKSQRNYFIAIILVLLISLISGGVMFFLKLKQIKAENKNILIQQKLLRSQMTPHFIFNSLSILQGLILNKEGEKSISYLSQFSKLLRMTLENSRHKTVSLQSELAAISSYMALQNLDADPPYAFTTNIDEELKNMKISIPPMLIQPFIENAIEHAFGNQRETKEIILSMKLKENQLVCTISDNGIGVNKTNTKHNKNKKSLATAITSERLEILAEDFKMPSSLKIENKASFGEKGTLTTLIIPYKIA